MSPNAIPYEPPEFNKDGFNCPACHAYADQQWAKAIAVRMNNSRDVTNVHFAKCSRCKQDSLWWNGELVVPRVVAAEPPHPEMPENCRSDFEEARSIAQLSPRGAAALLRLVVQKLMRHLGQEGRDLFKDTANLVREGMPLEVQMALDACRVIGNNAVHPGEMDLSDSAEQVNRLFGLVNFIVDDRISRPAALKAIYESLPEGARSAIELRDGKVSKSTRGPESASGGEPSAQVR